jgi:hypothetical protein
VAVDREGAVDRGRLSLLAAARGRQNGQGHGEDSEGAAHGSGESLGAPATGSLSVAYREGARLIRRRIGYSSVSK